MAEEARGGAEAGSEKAQASGFSLAALLITGVLFIIIGALFGKYVALAN